MADVRWMAFGSCRSFENAYAKEISQKFIFIFYFS